MKILIKNVRIFDPVSGIDEEGDVFIKNGIVSKKQEKTRNIIDGKGLYLFPAFIDIHTHIREPGGEDVENFESASRAAVAGGYSAIFMMPNTEPPIDNDGMVRFVVKRARDVGLVKIYPVGAATIGRRGERLTDMRAMIECGCIGFSDDGSPVKNPRILRRILEYLKGTGIKFIEHPEDPELSSDGSMNEGSFSNKLGVPGIPWVSEASVVIRDILIAEYLSSPIHFAHISTEASLDLIQFGRRRGVKITFEVTPHHLLLDENDVRITDSNFKMNPPLRSRRDRKALIKALKKGFVNAIATDHAPHPIYKKELEFSLAPFGVIGLETSFPTLYTELVKNGVIGLKDLIEYMSVKPAGIFGLKTGMVKDGATADFVLIDLKKKWKITEEKLHSLSRNSPFLGWDVYGRVVYTIVNGKVVYKEGD